jgi:hypothetical protein
MLFWGQSGSPAVFRYDLTFPESLHRESTQGQGTGRCNNEVGFWSVDMATERETSDPMPEFGGEELTKWRVRLLEQTSASYNRILNRLWIRNGAGVVATFTLICDISKDGRYSPHQYLQPLFFFTLGIALLAIGAVIDLVQDAAALRDMENASSILELVIGHARRPSERAGLSFLNWQTRMAAAAAVAMSCGGIAWLIILRRI